MTVPKTERKFVILSDGSFRETRDDQEEKRPKKRQRVDSDDEEEVKRACHGVRSPSPRKRTNTSEKGSSKYASGSGDKHHGREGGSKRLFYSRDPDFFYEDFSDANIYVGVEDTVFKIHRHVLDSCPVMVEIFEGSITKSKTSEESPLVLEKPTVEEYKAFLWTNYATVEELNAPPHENEFLSRLHLIVALTQKYEIPKLASWTSTAVSALTNDRVFLSSCSSLTLTNIAAACVAYKLTEPLAALTAAWTARLERGDTPSAPAIIAADVLKLPASLRGLAYYVHVQDMVDRRGVSATGAMQLRSDDKLNNGQILRLFAGHMSLVGFWENLRIKPIALPVPPVSPSPSDPPPSGDPATPSKTSTTTATANPAPSSPAATTSTSTPTPTPTPTSTSTQTPGTPTTTTTHTCPGGDAHQKRCVATWERRWISAAGWKRILGLSDSDTLGLLACLRDELANDEETRNGMEPACRAAGLEAMRALRERVKEDLNDHFKAVA